MNNEGVVRSFSPGRLLDVFLQGLKRLWWLVLLLTLLGGVGMGYRAWTSYVPSYSASVTFSVYTVNENQSSVATFNQAAAQQMEKTFPYILTSGVLSDLVKADVGTSALPSISATAVEGANMIVLSVKGGDAKLCYDVLQSVIKNYPQVAEFVVGPTYMNIVDETGMPDEPDNQRNWTDSAKKGVVVGLALGLVLAFIYGYTKSTVMGREDLQNRSNVRYLGTLPTVAVKKRSKMSTKNLTLPSVTDRYYRESFRTLAVRLDKRMRDREQKTLLICSAASGEGKTTVAYNLAYSFAKLHRKVLLIDCDLRNPSMYKMTGEKECAGLTEILEGTASAATTVHKLDDFDVLYAGENADENDELMRGGIFTALIDGLKEVYDYVLIDTPPCSLLTDAEDVAEICDAAIMVIKQNYASRSSVIESMTRLSESGTEVSGYILNAVSGGTMKKNGYGYGYGYKYGYGYGYGYGKNYGDTEADGTN